MKESHPFAKKGLPATLVFGLMSPCFVFLFWIGRGASWGAWVTVINDVLVASILLAFALVSIVWDKLLCARAARIYRIGSWYARLAVVWSAFILLNHSGSRAAAVVPGSILHCQVIASTSHGHTSYSSLLTVQAADETWYFPAATKDFQDNQGVNVSLAPGLFFPYVQEVRETANRFGPGRVDDRHAGAPRQGATTPPG